MGAPTCSQHNPTDLRIRDPTPRMDPRDAHTGFLPARRVAVKVGLPGPA
jgi:hypothetical protein